MVNNRYTRTVDALDISREALSAALSMVKHEAVDPSDDHIIKPRMKRYKKGLLIAAVIIIVLNIGMVTASGIMGVNLYEEVYRFFDESINPKYVESYENIESVSSGITVKVTDAIADGYCTMVRLDINDPNLKDDLTREDVFSAMNMGLGGVDLYDEFGNHYEMSGISGAGLGTESTGGMVVYFDGGPELACEMHLFIKTVNQQHGGWDMKFTVKPYLNAKKYTCDTLFEFKNGTKIRIDAVERYITCTLIKGTYLKMPDYENDTLNDAKLYLDEEIIQIRSGETTGDDLEIKFEASEYDLIEPMLRLDLSSGESMIKELNLTEE